MKIVKKIKNNNDDIDNLNQSILNTSAEAVMIPITKNNNGDFIFFGREDESFTRVVETKKPIFLNLTSNFIESPEELGKLARSISCLLQKIKSIGICGSIDREYIILLREWLNALKLNNSVINYFLRGRVLSEDEKRLGFYREITANGRFSKNFDRVSNALCNKETILVDYKPFSDVKILTKFLSESQDYSENLYVASYDVNQLNKALRRSKR